MSDLDEATEPAGGSAEVSTGTVWHYTGAAGLMGILKDHELWASSAIHMNDTTELNLGVSRVEEALNEAGLTEVEHRFVGAQLAQASSRLSGSQTFVLSASTNGDSLSQWRAYGGGYGYAVGLDASERLDLFAAHDLAVDLDRDAEYTGDIFQYVSGWLRVAYERAEQLSAATQMIREVAQYAGKPQTSLSSDSFTVEIHASANW